MKKYYGADIEDPLLYDLVINTDRVSYDEAARQGRSRELTGLRPSIAPSLVSAWA